MHPLTHPAYPAWVEPVPGAAIACWCRGEGAPAVVLLPGLGGRGEEWQAVEEGLEGLTRICRYDRAGVGRSPAPRKTPRTPDDLVDELHGVLHQPGLRAGPCLLVGHSFGGLLARLYQARHPKDVAALLLVESMHEAQFDRLGPHVPPLGRHAPAPLRRWHAFWSGGYRDPKGNDEAVDLVAMIEAVGRECNNEQRLPASIRSGRPYRDRKLFPDPQGSALEAAWADLQADLVRRFDGAEGEQADEASHHLHRDAPEVVIAAATGLITRLRHGARHNGS